MVYKLYELTDEEIALIEKIMLKHNKEEYVFFSWLKPNWNR